MEYQEMSDSTAIRRCQWQFAQHYLPGLLGVVIFGACLLLEVLSLSELDTLPMRVVMLDGGSNVSSALNVSASINTGCLPFLHESFLGFQLPKESHYCFHRGTVFFEPIPGCRLAPPQPFWFNGLLTVVKGIGIYLVMYTKIKDDYSTFQKYKTEVLAWATCAITVISVILLLIKAWSFNVPTMWQHYQCFGIVAADAPWAANLLLTGALFGQIDKVSVNEHLSASARDMFNRKSNSLLVATLATAVAMCFLIPFTITNIFWAILLGGCVSLGCSLTTWACLLPDTIDMSQCSEQVVERNINLWPCLPIPGAIAIAFVIQWMASASAYVETGQCTIFQAAAVATIERRSDIYLQNFQSAVLTQSTWFMELVNEMWP